jgi:hypothetical protein
LISWGIILPFLLNVNALFSINGVQKRKKLTVDNGQWTVESGQWTVAEPTAHFVGADAHIGPKIKKYINVFRYDVGIVPYTFYIIKFRNIYLN